MYVVEKLISDGAVYAYKYEGKDDYCAVVSADYAKKSELPDADILEYLDVPSVEVVADGDTYALVDFGRKYDYSEVDDESTVFKGYIFPKNRILRRNVGVCVSRALGLM